MNNSFYVQLAPYLLLEYSYSDVSYYGHEVKFGKITSEYYNGQCQLVNTSASQDITQNVLNYSAAQLGNYQWASLNINAPTPYISTDSKLTYEDLTVLNPISVTYDTVKVHIMSGYRLDDLDGLIIQAYVKEAQTTNTTILANNVYLNSDSRDILNPHPIFLGDKVYDRYVEFLIPSTKEAIRDFFANPLNSVSIGYQYSSDNRGFLIDTAVYIKAIEIESSTQANGKLIFSAGTEYEVNVNQEDKYAGLAANIQEASDGDYFTYYPTYDGNYIQDFISQLNASGGDYVVINDLVVYEQVGVDSLSTFSFSQIQTDGFEESLNWRPILKYPEHAVAFSIDYTCRIYNRSNGFQMIRKASVTSYNPRKYGKRLDRISLSTQSYPLKVYNKVYDGPTVSYSKPEGNTQFNTVYIPVFFDRRNVVVQQQSITSVNDGSTINEFYFGQGQARIYLGDADNYVKFIINDVNKANNAISHIDLSYGTVNITFKDKKGKLITIPAEDSTSTTLSSSGEVVFKITSDLVSTILYDSKVKPFRITIKTDDTNPTILYSGTVDTVDNLGNESERLNTLKQSSATVTSSAIKVSTTGASGTNITSGTSTSNAILQNQVQPSFIPGYSNNDGSISIRGGVKPISNTTVKAGMTGSSTTTKNK
jgi:hypothetical protein